MYKKQNGITLSILVITVVVIVILTGTIIVSSNIAVAAKKRINMESDILVLQEYIPIYYEKNGELPLGDFISQTQTDKFGDQKNVNDEGEYYIIQLELMPELQLNYGYGVNSSVDYYVMNLKSFAIYYAEGINTGDRVIYTINQTDSTINNSIQAPNNFEISTTSTATTITVTGTTTSDLGIKGYKFRINNEAWTDLQTNGEYVFENLTPGTTYKISMQAIDNENNIIMADNNGVEATTVSDQLANGMFDTEKGANSPDTSNLPTTTTKYVRWDWSNIDKEYDETTYSTPPNNWYDYNNGQWANIKTTSTDKKLEAYWVWIPRFAYKLPESSTAKQIDVIFVRDTGTTGANGEKCYYSTDTAITSDGSGLYTSATALALGTETGKEQAWIIHPAFTFGDTQLAGIWVAKYEASSSTPTASYGGGNDNTLKVQVVPSVTSWRYIQTANAWEVCRAMQEDGGSLGTAIDRNDTTATIDTHMAKNMEWGAVAVLSQSKYGIFNPQSATGLTENGGDGTLKVWNNPNSSYITGTVGSVADAASVADASCARYNSETGPKGSTTGTVYGVYDTAGGAYELIMGVQATSATTTTTPANGSTGFGSSNPWPNAKYYDIYPYGESYNDDAAYSRGKIGDLTRELNPAESLNWNGDPAYFVVSYHPLFVRGDAATSRKSGAVCLPWYCGWDPRCRLVPSYLGEYVDSSQKSEFNGEDFCQKGRRILTNILRYRVGGVGASINRPSTRKALSLI